MHSKFCVSLECIKYTDHQGFQNLKYDVSQFNTWKKQVNSAYTIYSDEPIKI